MRPAETAGCALPAVPLYVGKNHPKGIGGTPFQAEVARILATRPRAPLAPGGTEPPLEILVLSGGSQHGLFGTGFFLGLPRVPDYDIVTGVSTGALQSTFLFLANDPVVPRDYPDDLGFPAEDIPRHSSNVADLALASSITREASLLNVGSFGLVGGVIRGAVASLEPLEERLLRFITWETLQRVARQAKPPANRKLYVGVTDLDDGNGYAIDLTRLAQRVDDPAWQGRREGLRRCYADALIASSAVPLAAYPVSMAIHDTTSADPQSVRHDLFIDGGARYGVFYGQLLDAAAAIARPTNVTLVVNGSLYSGDWQEKNGQPVGKWSAISAGLRAVDLLENQVYRFSVEDVERRGLANGTLKMAFISNENLPGAEPPDQHRFDGRTCAAWTQEDDKASPVQFHPHYMACLLDYGRSRGRLQQWNLVKSSAAPAGHQP